MKPEMVPGVIALLGVLTVGGYVAYDRVSTAEDRVETLRGVVEILKEDLRLERQEGDPALEAIVQALRREVDRLRMFIRRLGFDPPSPGPGTEEGSGDPEPTGDPSTPGPKPTPTKPTPSPSPTCVPLSEVCADPI